MSNNGAKIDDSRIKLDRDLTEIVRLSQHLDEEAVHKANARVDGTGLPGGLAMIAMGPVGNLEAWGNRFDSIESGRVAGNADAMAEDEDPNYEPPLQSLLFWTDEYRREWGSERQGRPTIASEAAWLKGVLDWAWEHELRWDDLCADVRRARVRMESVLYAGVRAERGVPCMYDECRGKRIIRKHVPARDEDGDKTWALSKWHCPSCHREWDADQYAAMVTAAAWRAQAEEIDGEMWCTTKYAATMVKRPDVTVRAWLSKGLLSSVCVVAGRRMPFVRLADVEDRATNARKRAA